MKYSLVGVDGNAFAILGYTAKALKQSGHAELVEDMRKRATNGDYENLIYVCSKYIEIANGEA